MSSAYPCCASLLWIESWASIGWIATRLVNNRMTSRAMPDGTFVFASSPSILLRWWPFSVSVIVIIRRFTMATTESDANKKRWRAGAKYCVYGSCKTNSNNCEEGVYFIPFPKPTTPIGIERAKRWINLCRREGMSLEWINKNRYVCSQHFVDPRGPTDMNPDPIPATSSMAVYRKNPPKRLNYDRKKLICKKLKSKTIFLQQKNAIGNQHEDLPIVENIKQGERITEVNVPLHELLTPQCNLEEQPQHVTSELIKVVENQHDDNCKDGLELQTSEQQLEDLVVTDEINNNKDVPCNNQDDHCSQVMRVIPITVNPQTSISPAPPISRNASVADVIISCNNLVHTIMKHFDNWFVKFHLESDAYTAQIVKMVNYQQAVTVNVTLRRKKFHVSIDIYKYRLRESHPLWVAFTQPVNLVSIVKLLNDVSQWQICLKLRNTPLYNMKSTTTCMLLCELPSVICAKCRYETQKRMTDVRNDALTDRNLMSMQHRLMSKQALGAKLELLRKKLKGVTVQNKRLKSKMAAVSLPVPSPIRTNTTMNKGYKDLSDDGDLAQRALMDMDPKSMTKQDLCVKFGVLRKVYKAGSLRYKRLRKKLAEVLPDGGGEDEVADDVVARQQFKMKMQHKYMSKDALCEKYEMLRNAMNDVEACNAKLKERIVEVVKKKRNGADDGTVDADGTDDEEELKDNY